MQKEAEQMEKAQEEAEAAEAKQGDKEGKVEKYL